MSKHVNSTGLVTQTFALTQDPRSRPIERSLFHFIWKYSKRDQLILLVVTACLFPLLYLTLELPKRIINDAIGAQSSTIEVWGQQFDQLTYLWILCGAFLLAVLAHGLTKMRINTMKGVLAERMLRRFRYSLIARVLRFPQPYFERTSQGELVSMITSESEPMGGLMGDAVSQPVLQAGQMLTILYFLFAQNFWFGLAAVALIPLQGWLIPLLQRRINLLNKKRIQQVRALASEIGESAVGASTLRVNGGWRYRMARVTERLGRLYEIRFEIYQKKFFMKFLNNFITQLTPFFFYAVGGYLVLQGKVSLGALVAALAAYKDLASPWKELLTYYNQTQDMSLRWEVILERFAPPDMVDERLMQGEPETLPHLDGDIVLDGVSVRDADGNLVLEELSATFPKGELIGIAAPSEEDRRALAEVLTREVLPASGTVTLAGHDIRELHQMVLATRIGHATSRPALFQGSFGENVLMPLRVRPLEDPSDPRALRDAIRAGNSPDPFDVNWVDPKIAGFEKTEELRDWWLRIVEGIGSDTALLRRGMDQVFDKHDHPKLADALVQLRPRVQQALMDAGLDAFAHFNNRAHYNPALPVVENLLYATRSVPITFELLREQTEFLQTLRRIGLDTDLVGLAQDVLEMLRQIFGMDGTVHPLFRKLGLEASDYEAALQLLQKVKSRGTEALEPEELAQMMIVPFSISAEALGPAFSSEIEDRILTLRESHGRELLETLDDLFVPLHKGHFAPGFTVLENAIFGKISDNAGARAEDLRKAVAEVIDAAGVREMVVELIFDLPVSVGGQGLGQSFAEPLAFCRASIKRPDILILDGALASFDRSTRRAMQDNLRELLPQTTLIFLEPAFREPDRFDHYFEMRQGRLKDERAEDRGAGDEDSASAADLSRKLRALESTELFSGLNRRQLRLLAFGARWYEAAPGTAVFHKDDAATDGAYMIIEGEAGLYLPAESEGAEGQLIAKVGPGRLVGELGLIRKEPRALSMIAESDLTCLRIGEEEFLAVVENDANTAFKLLQVVAGYLSSQGRCVLRNLPQAMGKATANSRERDRMKLFRYRTAEGVRPGLIDAQGVARDLSSHVSDLGPETLGSSVLADIRTLDQSALPEISGEIDYAPCVAQVGKFLCIGLNYSDHAEEVGATPPEHPILFMKANSAIVGANDDVRIPRGSKATDWEVELGVVIGAAAKYVTVESALDHVAGYCIVNDVSERDFQMQLTGQWTKGKSCDTFGPIGPWLVTADEVADPQNLALSCDVNGTRMQTGNTDKMIFSVAEIISHLSQLMTLHPGDVIATGTPPGVGMGQKPTPVFLRDGDVMELKIQGLGQQRQVLRADG